MGELTGADGHSCLLRAMCEAQATPSHDEGVLGDIVDFVLTSNFVNEEIDPKFKKYSEAQDAGQVYKRELFPITFTLWNSLFQATKDCNTFNKKCPISFFKFIDNTLI